MSDERTVKVLPWYSPLDGQHTCYVLSNSSKQYDTWREAEEALIKLYEGEPNEWLCSGGAIGDSCR